MHGRYGSRLRPISCIHCPHRILAPYRLRSIANVVAEVEQLADRFRRPNLVFRDPLFTENRDRSVELAVRNPVLCRRVRGLDARVAASHSRSEIAKMARAVVC